jgi:hypothetical protein
MSEKYLNIVSFNVPYPADYGGVIDVFYKLKALKEKKVKIILHTFTYGREQAKELDKYCDTVFYYQRKIGVISQLSHLPYIVYSRRHENLLKNLQLNDYPILFEGLHSCYYLSHPALKNRLKLVRAHNVEHQYYKGLAENTSSFFKKNYFYWEALRLKKYEKELYFADFILALSSHEKEYFEKLYGKEKTIYLPLFFASEGKITLSESTKPYILYHGDLSTPENIHAAQFLIQSVAAQMPETPWVFAGKNPDTSILKWGKQYKNISIIANPTDNTLHQLIQEAKINLLYTNQISGVKLKLLNVLYNGNLCLVNEKMIIGSGLEKLCQILPEQPEEMIKTIKNCLKEDFSEEQLKQREIVFSTLYDNHKNAQILIDLYDYP